LVGMVPRESSTGGKQKLLGISKRGNPYLRKLFIQGARSVMLRGTKQSAGLRTWIENIALRKHHNVAAWLWRTKWPESPGLFWRKENPIDPPTRRFRAQPVWPADDACLRLGLEIASAIPPSTAQPRCSNKFFLPGLLANN
jgi:hypothetical protein